MDKRYVVTAYRWGWYNDHSYIVGVYDDADYACIVAQEEAQNRGGKYGCEVLRFQKDKRDWVFHAPSIYKEDRATHNYRIDMFESLGHLLYERARGTARYLTKDNFVKWRKQKPAKWITEAVEKEESLARSMNKAISKKLKEK